MDKTRKQDVFESMLFDTLSYETTPMGGRCTYSAETFIASLAGELSQSEEDRLSAHLLVCPSCANEYARLERSLRQEEERLLTQARVPSLAEQATRKKHNWNLLASVLPIGQHATRSLLALATAALLITLAVIIPLHYLPGRAPAIITADEQMVPKGDSTITPTTEVVAELTPESLVDRLDSMAGYEPWRATAFVIGYLRSSGVPLDSAALAFERQTTYTAVESDTWRTVAEKTLGDAGLWPIILLLNHNRTQHGEFPPAGTMLRVPATQDEWKRSVHSRGR